MRVEVSKIEAVERRELPKMQEVRTFLGLKMYYRRFVADYSTWPHLSQTLYVRLSKIKTPDFMKEFDLCYRRMHQTVGWGKC